MGQRLSSMVGPAKWAAVGALVTATGAGVLYSLTREPVPQPVALPPAPVVQPPREPVLISQLPENARIAPTPADAAVEAASATPAPIEQAPDVLPLPDDQPQPAVQNPPSEPKPAAEPAPKPAAAPKPQTPPVRPTPRFINVNTASAAELELLPDIGPSLAKAMIDYRTKNGAFNSLADLDKVPGIGPKTLEKLKDRVTFR